MGDKNQMMFVARHAPLLQEPILEVGSKNHGNTPDYRAMLRVTDYTGVDMEAGPNVDLTLDLTMDFSDIDRRLGGRRYKTVICASVLEHCRDPFKMCSTISMLVECGGFLYISVPFSWKTHGYPSDYWRFTPDGVKMLFPEFTFDAHEGAVSSSLDGDLVPLGLEPALMRIDLEPAKVKKRYGLWTIVLLAMAKHLRIWPRMMDHPYLFPPVLIHMLGVKKQEWDGSHETSTPGKYARQQDD